jgi:DNA-binding NtrC family response regulator
MSTHASLEGRELRVLIADDDVDMRGILRRMLERDGHHVVERTRGDEVLDAVRAEPFDLIILDKEMPGLTGLDLLPLLGRHHPRIPVILVTAFGGLQVAGEALRRGAKGYLEKPFGLGLLRGTIQGLRAAPAGNTAATPSRDPN